MKEHPWNAVSSTKPCLICSKSSWCQQSQDGTWCMCRRVDTGHGIHRTDRSGVDYWLYRLDGSQAVETAAPSDEQITSSVSCAFPEDRHRVYTELLRLLDLSDAHRANLADRGLDDHHIKEGGYRTLPGRGRARVARKLLEKFGPDLCAQIPGLYRKTEGDRTWWSLAGVPGLLVPVRDVAGQIIALTIRSDDPEADAKYIYFSSKRHGGPGPGAHVHVPVHDDHDHRVVRVTEGGIKADIATALSKTFTISIPGVSCWRMCLPTLKELGATRIKLAFDADARTNPHVATALDRTFRGLVDTGYDVAIETWSEELGKGIDDLLAAGHLPVIHAGDAARESIRATLSSAGVTSSDDADDADDHSCSTREKVARVLERIEQLEIDPDQDWLDVLDDLEENGIIRAIAELGRSRTKKLTTRLARRLGHDPKSEEALSLREAARETIREIQEEQREAKRSRRAAEPNTVDLLIEIAFEARLFRDELSEPFAQIEVGEHHEVHPVASTAFTEWLAKLAWDRYRDAPSDTSLKSALRVISARSKFDGTCEAVHVRVCQIGNVVWYDLCDDRWRAIRCTLDGWEVVENPAVLFRRFTKSAPQVDPQRGGSIDELRRFFHVRREHDWYLLLAFLVAGLIPGTPRPVLVWGGEQGSAKTTSAKICIRILDPTRTELISPPRSIDEYAQSAHHCWVLAFDNVSHIPQWLSDAMCRTATGDAFEKRKLYSDADDVIWQFRRVVVLTGIANMVTRPDLLDRSLLVTLEPFAAGERRLESEFWAAFEAARPRILGALLDLVAKVLCVLPDVHVPSEHRLVDFARIGVALERVLGWPGKSFEEALAMNAEAQVSEAIEASPLAQALLRFMESRGEWVGTASQLLGELNDIWEKEEGRLPKQANQLSGELRRAAPALRKTGLELRWTRSEGRDRQRAIRVRKLPDPSSASSDIVRDSKEVSREGPEEHAVAASNGHLGANTVDLDDPALLELLGQDITDRGEDSR